MGYLQEARENHVKKKVEEGGKGESRQEEGRGSFAQQMKQKALKECDFYCSKYAECARGRTFSVVWLCRKQAKELNDCLHQFTNDAVLEEMKKVYMAEQESKEKNQ